MSGPTVPSPAATTKSESQPSLVRGLSLMDSVLLLTGGIIGAGVFLTPKDIAAVLHTPSLFIGIWAVGGAITMLGCLAFAELGAIYPEAGGQYLYLREAYGDFIAFLYGWMVFTVYNTGGIAALAVGFGAYLAPVVPGLGNPAPILAVGSWVLTRPQVLALICIAVLTAVNVYGLRRGAILQDVSSWMKFLAIGAFLLLGIFWGKGSWSNFSAAAYAPQALNPRALAPALGLALIAVFWGYDSWTYIGWVAGEVKHPQRTIPRSLVLSILIVATIYVLMNVLYLYAMPISEIAQHETIARASAERLFSPAAGVWISAMIALSSFGATSAAILSGARVYYAMAADGLFFRRMGTIHPRWRTPAFSLIVQGIWASILTLSGRYDQLFTYAIFMGVLASCLTVGGLFILRRKRPQTARPFRCTGYPWVPALYVLVSGAWALNTLFERPLESLGGTLIVLLGVPGYLYWKRTSRKATT
jgi:APA family basic amino acid/polyamine antiporter